MLLESNKQRAGVSKKISCAYELQRRKIMAGNRQYKSDVFSMLLEDPKNALEVFNAVNGTDYDDPSKVEIYLLDKGVSLSIYNDASFILDMNLSLYEHQSTYNPNVPLRNLFYIANLLQKLINKRDLYGSRLIKIPTPRFAVFYNGTEQRPEVEELRLSTAFENSIDEPEIELVCKVYNINQGQNMELLKRCKVLEEYMFFVDKVRYYVKELGDEQEKLETAIERAIDDCIKNHILEEFLKSRRGEVVKVVQLDYTWERREELIRKEQYEEGRQQERKENILILLESLGPVPDELRQRIMKVTDEQSQISLLKLAAKVDSLEEYSKRMNDMLK